MPDKPRLPPERVEQYAIRVALGNNGGTWAEHYTEEQKDHWRQFIDDLVLDIWWDAYKQGQLDGMQSGTAHPWKESMGR